MGVMEDLQTAAAGYLALRTQVQTLLDALEEASGLIPRMRIYNPDNNETVWSDVDLTATPKTTHAIAYPSAFPGRRTALHIIGQTDARVVRKGTSTTILASRIDIGGASSLLRNQNAWVSYGAAPADGSDQVSHVTHVVGAIKPAGVETLNFSLVAWWQRDTPLGSQGDNTAWSGFFDNFALAVTEYVVDNSYALSAQAPD